MNTLLEIQEKVRNAKELDFGDIFSQCIELFKKVWVQGLLLQLFTVIVMLPIIIILYIPLIGMMMASSSGGFYNPSELESFFAGFSLLYLVVVLLVSLKMEVQVVVLVVLVTPNHHYCYSY